MSSFIDVVTINVRAGDGGDGLVSFRREKFIDRGGPDGGDGGRGGNVVARATRNLNTLQSFRHRGVLAAEDGQPGGPQRKRGKNGADLIVDVPIGTVIKNGLETVADLTQDGQEAVIALGGHGGYGNAHFISSTRQAPRVAEKGEPGAKYEAQMEIKLIADVGLVGLPNAGKSTFLSVVSNARPEIADYEFTTLVPNLGVADIDDSSILIADIPGLIAGASEGKGLGDQFLRHIERTAVLLHLIDAYQTDAAGAYKTIMAELKAYDVDLSGKPMVVAITKTEGLDDELIEDVLKQLRPVVPKKTKLFAISAQAKTGLQPVLRALKTMVASERRRQAKAKPKSDQTQPLVYRLDGQKDWHVERLGRGRWLISGRKIDKFVRRTDFDNEWGVHRLLDIMRKIGVMHELARQGAAKGDKLSFKATDQTIEY